MESTQQLVDSVVLNFLHSYRDFWNSIDGEPCEDDSEDQSYEPEEMEVITEIVEVGGSRDARLRWPLSFQWFARWLPVLAANSNCEMNEGFDEMTRDMVDRHLQEKSRGFL